MSPLPYVQLALLRTTDAAAARLGLLDRPFDPDALIAAAQRKSGLTDFGDEAFREPLGHWLEACAAEAAPGVVGRSAVRWDAIRFLTNLLLLRKAEKDDPAILGRQIARPIFITGLPRSGTTFLHKLLMIDPANQGPRVWQTIYPYPGNDGRGGSRDAPIRQVDRQLRAFGRLAPDFHNMHPIDATSPQECSEITAHVFKSLRFDTTFRIPSYRRWLDCVGHAEAYRFHRRFLQHLQGRLQDSRWVLKCPDHVFALDALRSVYPDARIVFVHRDPIKVLSSVTRLTEVLRAPFTRRIQRLEIGRDESARWFEGTQRIVAAARTHASDPSTMHILYRDLVADPLATVERLYDRFELDLSASAADRIRQATREEPRGGYGANRYRLEDYGLDPAAEREKFTEYAAFFGIEREGEPKVAAALARAGA